MCSRTAAFIAATLISRTEPLHPDVTFDPGRECPGRPMIEVTPIIGHRGNHECDQRLRRRARYRFARAARAIESRRRAARDNLSELVGADAVDEDEQAEDEMFELDQAELDALGLTLDDPHQPGP